MKKVLIGLVIVGLVVYLFLARTTGANNIIVDNQRNWVTISAENVREPTLGLAFHLQYGEDWQYQDYQLGEFFQQQQQKPVVLIDNDSVSRQLIVGISLKRNQQLPLGSGEIIGFDFVGKGDSSPNQIAVSNAVIRQSVAGELINGEVDWQF